MREGVYRAKKISDKKWAEGSLIECGRPLESWIFPYEEFPDNVDIMTIIHERIAKVDASTVCSFTGLLDYYTKLIWENDIVKLFDSLGVVKFEAGCFGVYFADGVPWEKIKEELPSWTHCSHSELHSCCNDHFVSMWELYWNFNCEEQCMEMLTVQGNVFDNPDLLR